MSLTQQTWIYPTLPTNVSSPFNTSNAILAIKNALDGWTAGHWQTDVYSAGSHLKIKRKGTPAGTLSTFRALVFGRTSVQSPNAPAQDALAGNNAYTSGPAPDTLYCGVGEDIGTAAVTSPTTGNPFPGTKFTGGLPMLSALESSTGYSVFLCSCDTMLVIFMYNETQAHFTILGEIIEKVADGTGAWGVLVSPTATPASEMTAVTASLLPVEDSYAAYGAMYEAGAVKRMCRMNSILPVVRSPLFSGNAGAGILLPVIMGYSDINDYTSRQLFGTLRQVRMGPYDVGRKLVRDTGGTIQAIFLNGGSATLGSGLYLDQNL